MIHFEGLGKSYHGKTVLKNISGRINRGEKIGLIGVNGIGKTTLARLLTGEEAPDCGTIKYASPLPNIIYLPQYPVFAPGISLYEELYQTVVKSSNGEEDLDALVKKTLNQAGLQQALWENEADKLSGGEKTKLMLCKILIRDFDLLLLDEPTNHLDMESSAWLEKTIGKLNKTVLIISHNRYLLDSVVDKIWELTSRGLKIYKGNYSAYKAQKKIELKNAVKEYEKQQLRIKHLRQIINKKKNRLVSTTHKEAGQSDFCRGKAKKQAVTIKTKEKELERLEKNRVEKPLRAVSPAFDIINKSIINEKLPPIIIKANNLSKKYKDKLVFQNVSFNFHRRDKVALIGENGAGKTTLLKIICGIDKDYQGSLVLNPSLKIGYFSQEFEGLNPQNTVLDNVMTENIASNEARLLLAALLFRKNDVFKPIGGLSMGEKCRVVFAKLVLSGANLLVLDEPTNYLDILSKEKIEEVLEDFEGSLLFVSHDKYLVKRIATKVMKLESGYLKYFNGGYDYYLEKTQKGQKANELGLDHTKLRDRILRLECELAYLGSRLNERLNEHEKEYLSEEFLAKAKELNDYRNLWR
jgi:ATPase subunit of ABC transporter with duplicated ATPase domains